MSDDTNPTPDTISDPADQPGPVTAAPGADASDSPSESSTPSTESSSPSTDPAAESDGSSSASTSTESPDAASSESSDVAPGLYVEIGPGVVFRAQESDRSRLLDKILSGGMISALDSEDNVVVLNATAAPYLRILDSDGVVLQG